MEGVGVEADSVELGVLHPAGRVRSHVLAKQREAARTFVAELVGTFRTSTAGILARLAAARPEPEGMAEVQRDAHSLKSSAATLSATALSDRARRLEAAAEAGADPDTIAELVSAVEEAAAAALDALGQIDGG